MIATFGCVLLAVLAAPASTPARLAATGTGIHALRLARAASTPSSSASVAGPSGQRPARGRFLVANRTLLDPNFSETVVLLLDYDERGAMGVVINRPTTLRLAAALPQLKELRGRPDHVYIGGPIALNLVVTLIRSAKHPESSQLLFGDVYVTGSARALQAAAAARGKVNRLRIYAGHAGWGPGQLDLEIARGDWYVVDADAATVFDVVSAKIWPTLIERLSGQWTHDESQHQPVALVGTP